MQMHSEREGVNGRGGVCVSVYVCVCVFVEDSMFPSWDRILFSLAG